MDSDKALFIAKLALIESLVRDLYVERFERHSKEPLKAAERLAEGYDKGHTALANPSIPQPMALLHNELQKQFFDDVIAELRRRAEIRSQKG